MYSKTGNFSILLVDDSPTNIDVLAEILKTKYQVRAVTNGQSALDIANSAKPPDLVLLDIMMPEMDGFEVCRRLKAIEKTKEIPVIFVTARGEVQDEAEGLRIGAVDYITKPFDPLIVKARVKTHLALKQAKAELQDMLNKTLAGSIKVLIEILSLLKPDVFSKASRLKRYAKGILEILGIEDSWQYELAAMLSHIGFISLPDVIIKKVTRGQRLSDEEESTFRKYPAVGAELVSRIPRLEAVARMIEHQREPFCKIGAGRDLFKSEPFVLGAHILKVVNDYDQMVSRGMSIDAAVLRMCNDMMTYEPNLVNRLRETLNVQESKLDLKSLKISEMDEGMILDENIYSGSDSRKLLVARGTEISGSILSRLVMLEKISLVTRPLRVLVPVKDNEDFEDENF